MFYQPHCMLRKKNVTVPKQSFGSFPQPPGLAGAHLTKGRVAALSWFYWEKPMPKPMGFRWFSHPVKGFVQGIPEYS